MTRPRPLRKWLVPLLPGAPVKGRLLGVVAACMAIGLTAMAGGVMFNDDYHLPLILAPLGASAVLLFAVPSSPLAQPWPVIGGNSLSAACGALCAYLISDPAWAGGAAVALAIAVMSVTRSLHPPGGAMALTAVLAGSQASLFYPFVPAALNSATAVLAAILLNRAFGTQYPHKAASVDSGKHGTADKPATRRLGFTDDDIDVALDQYGEALDVSRDDLKGLMHSVEAAAAARVRPDLLASQIMSRDIVSIDPASSQEEARRLLIAHNLRTLPVTTGEGRVIGVVGLRQLAGSAKPGEPVGSMASAPILGALTDPAFSLAAPLLDGSTHAVVIVDDRQRLLGIVTQTDLLAAAIRSLPVAAMPQSELRLAS